MNSNYFNTFSRCYLIAEIGVNHNGEIKLAKEMIREAKNAGADAVKFQTFLADLLVTQSTPKVNYQKTLTSPYESHYEMIKRLEMGKAEHLELFVFCSNLDIDFISTPYDIESAKFLNDMGVSIFKTASADLVDLPLQDFIASTGKPAMVATGMSSLGEIEQTVGIYAENNNNNLLLLQCVSNYPCSDASLNLRTLNTLSSAFGVPVGYSDHSDGFLAAVLSVALGAKVIEKHFTLSKDLPGPDHKASSTVVEFKELVQNVRRTELVLGCGRKVLQAEEVQMASVSRKSVVVTRAVRKGEIFSQNDLRLMRPGTGLGANFLKKIVGKRAMVDVDAFHQLAFSDVENL